MADERAELRPTINPVRDIYDNMSALDYRYYDPEVAVYLSENGFTRYMLKTEAALATTIHRRGLCDEDIAREIVTACFQVTTGEVYDEESRIKHDIRALANCIRGKVSERAKPFVHLMTTSFDIRDTANAGRYKDVTKNVAVPVLKRLEGALIDIVLREAKTEQVGRTHGQHAVRLTVGFALAEYISRIGGCIESLDDLSTKLIGKFSGAVGAYNASSLFFEDPESFEREVLGEMGLKPGDHSTQIVHPEPKTRLLAEYAIVAGVMGNLADDMRHLQRTEIGEVGELFEEDQEGSSAMPQKRNPINFENSKSVWKIVAPKIITVFMDQISEHQRDLTNSASSRTEGEMISYTVSAAKRLAKTMSTLVVDRNNLERNLALQGDLTMAEPLYILLAASGHPDAHRTTTLLTKRAQLEGRSLIKVAKEDPNLELYFDKMTGRQREILDDPSRYVGIAAKKAVDVAATWKEKLGL